MIKKIGGENMHSCYYYNSLVGFSACTLGNETITYKEFCLRNLEKSHPQDQEAYGIK
jgi:hypothetical protein